MPGLNWFEEETAQCRLLSTERKEKRHAVGQDVHQQSPQHSDIPLGGSQHECSRCLHIQVMRLTSSSGTSVQTRRPRVETNSSMFVTKMRFGHCSLHSMATFSAINSSTSRDSQKFFCIEVIAVCQIEWNKALKSRGDRISTWISDATSFSSSMLGGAGGNEPATLSI